MTIKELLVFSGLYSKEIKLKISQGNIKVNNKPLFSEDMNQELEFFEEAGKFIYRNLDDFKNITCEIDVFFDTNFRKDKHRELHMLRVNKKLSYVIKFKQSEMIEKYKENHTIISHEPIIIVEKEREPAKPLNFITRWYKEILSFFN